MTDVTPNYFQELFSSFTKIISFPINGEHRLRLENRWGVKMLMSVISASIFSSQLKVMVYLNLNGLTEQKKETRQKNRSCDHAEREHQSPFQVHLLSCRLKKSSG